MNKNLTTKAVREYWGEALSADEYVSHPYGVTYEVYEYEGDTLGKYVETVPYTDFFTTEDQAEEYINEFNSHSLEERNLKDQQYIWDTIYDKNKEHYHKPKTSINETKMNKELLRMQLLSGVITESEYKAKLEELNNPKEKKSLNENFVGMGMVGNIFDREKTDYELAFEHFLGERYQLKPNRERDDIKDINEEEVEEDLNESALAIAGGVILGVLGLKVIFKIIKGISGAVSLIRMTDPKELKKAVAEIGKEAMQRGKNPLQIALWMSTVESMIDNGEIKNGVELGKTWGNVDKIDLEKAFSSSESKEVEEDKKSPLYENPVDLDELSAQINAAFDSIEDMPLDPAAKLQMAKFGLGMSILNALGEKINQGGDPIFNKPDSQEKFQTFISDIKNATSVEEVKQTLLNVIKSANS